jgi:hypothetical protein
VLTLIQCTALDPITCIESNRPKKVGEIHVHNFTLECPRSHERPGCSKDDINYVIADFKGQNGRLQEETEDVNILPPKSIYRTLINLVRGFVIAANVLFIPSTACR